MAQREALTIADFEKFMARPENRDHNFELFDGLIVEKGYTEEHGVIAAFITTEIGMFLRENPFRRVAVSAHCQMPEDNYFSLQPDVSVFKSPSQSVVKKGAIPRMPDLAIEIKSPDDSFKGLRTKAEYYLEHGTQTVWLIYPENKLVEVYTTNADSRILSERDVRDGGEVLPGFSVKVEDIFKE